MTDLVAFLNARISEDEAAALAAGGGVHDREWDQPYAAIGRSRIEDGHGEPVVTDDDGLAEAPTAEQAAHIARHDPARVLREVEAKRRILVEASNDDVGAYSQVQILRALAAVYFDHPDYDPAWT